MVLLATGTASSTIGGAVPPSTGAAMESGTVIRILRATVCGGVAVEPGARVVASSRDAQTLIRMGKAVEVEADEQPVDEAPRRGPGRPRKGSA